MAERGSGERYWLYGADELEERGFAVGHSFEPDLIPQRRHRALDRALNALVRMGGGYGGDFATVLACRSRANRADVVYSTVDTVGIPLALLASARLVRRPFVYASIGLLERIEQLRNRLARRAYERALGGAAVVVAYGHAEAEALRAWLARLPAPPEVRFIPFGVDTGYFRPEPGSRSDVDVLALGADPRRDYALLAHVAARLPDRSFSIVASADQARALVAAPANMTVESDVPFAEVRGRLARARVVALPVRDNRYTGATTTLLQAMAMAKPVVVSRTAAIAEGYGLVDGENCRLVEPGDEESFAAALEETLEASGADELGARGRELVERELTWDRYVDAVADALRVGANSTRSVPPG